MPPKWPVPMLPPFDQDGRPLTPSADVIHNDLSFPELLDLVHILLQQHETRLCINMLEALKETDCAYMTRRLQDFVDVQLSSPNEALQALAQRVQGSRGYEGSCVAPKKRLGPCSLLDGEAMQAMPSREVAISDLSSQSTRLSTRSTLDKAKSIKKPDGATASPAHPANGFHVSQYLEVNGSPQPSASSHSKPPPSGEVHVAPPQVENSVPSLPEDASNCVSENEEEECDDFSDSEDEVEENEGSRNRMTVAVRKQAGLFRKRQCIVHPSSSGRLAWDGAGLAFVCVEGVGVPLSLGFDIELSQVWQWIATVFFAMDMVSQFFTGFFRKGTLIMQHRIIISHYLKSFFFIDLIATVPWEVLMQGIAGGGATTLSLARVARVGKTLRLFRLIRVFRIVRMKELLMHLETLLAAYKAGLVIQILKVPAACLVICHWSACAWGFLGQPEIGSQPHSITACEPGGPCEFGIEGSGWVKRYGLDNYEASVRYLIALQSAAGLLTGVGMSVEPGFWMERIYTLLMMIGSFFLCAVILSRIVVVVDEMSKSQSELKKQLRDAKAFMLTRKIPRTLQSKVMQHLEFQAKQDVENLTNSKNFMASLSPWLRLEITEHMNRGVILHHPFFAELPNKLVKHICSIMQIVICAPGDIVVQQGHRATNMCFLVHGRLKVRPPQQHRKTNASTRVEPIELDPPCWIGDRCLFDEGAIRTNTVISVGHAELLVLTRENLLALMQEFPRARRYYEAYKKRMINEEKEQLSLAKIKCQYCLQPGHHGPDCPDLEKVCKSKSGFAAPTVSQRHSLLRLMPSYLTPSMDARESIASSKTGSVPVQDLKSIRTLDDVVCNQKEAAGVREQLAREDLDGSLKGNASQVLSFPQWSVTVGEAYTPSRRGDPQSGIRYATSEISSAPVGQPTSSADCAAGNPSIRLQMGGAQTDPSPTHAARSGALNALPGQPPKDSDDDSQDNFLR